MLAHDHIISKAGLWSFKLFNSMVVLFFILPFVAIIPMSFSSGMFLSFPPPSFSTRWYSNFLSSASWNNATILSFEVAAIAMIFATLLGTLAALSVGQRVYPKKFPVFKTLLIGLFVSPAVCPIVVAAVAKLMFFLKINLYDTMTGLVIAHTVLGSPFVFISVLSSLNNLDRSVEKAAANLGASHMQTLFRVTLPLIGPGVFLGAIFAFMNSFNEIVVTVFITGTNAVTLSRKLWDGIQYEIDPTITVVSTLLIVFSFIIFALFSLLMRRTTITLSGFSRKG